MNIKSKQFNGKMHSTMKIACYSTHTVDLKTKTTHSTRELKNIKSKPKEPAEKNPSKRQLFRLPRSNALQCEKH